MFITIDGVKVEFNLEFGRSTRVQNLDGTWSTHLAVTPIIISPRPPGPEGEPLPIEAAA